MPAWVIWAVVAVLLALGEIFTPGLFFLGPIALAALASTVVAAAGGPIWLQVVVFGVGSFAAVGLLRPIARKHLTIPRAINGRGGARGREGDRPSARGWPRGAGQDRRRGVERPLLHAGPGVRRRHGGRGRPDPGRHSPGLQIANPKELNPAHGRRDRHHHRRRHRPRDAGA